MSKEDGDYGLIDFDSIKEQMSEVVEGFSGDRVSVSADAPYGSVSYEEWGQKCVLEWNGVQKVNVSVDYDSETVSVVIKDEKQNLVASGNIDMETPGSRCGECGVSIPDGYDRCPDHTKR